MAMGPETPQEVQVYLLEPTESEMASFLHANIGNGQKTAEIDVLAMGDQEIKEEMKDQEIKEEVKDQEIKEEKKDPEYDAKYFSSSTLREILQNETSTRSDYRVLPVSQMVQPEHVLEEEISPHVQALNNDDEIVFCSDLDELPLIDEADLNQQMKRQRFDCKRFDKSIACFEEGVLICAECEKKFTSKSTLIRHIKIHTLQFGVIRLGNDFTKNNNVDNSSECNQQMKEQRLDSASSDAPTACFEEGTQMVQTERILGEEESAHVQALNNDDKMAFSSDHDKFPLIDRTNLNQQEKKQRVNSRSTDKAIACFKEGVFICAECEKKFTSKSTLIRHIKIHTLQIGVTRRGNNFTKQNNVDNSAECNQQMKEQRLNSESSDAPTACFEEGIFLCAKCDKKFTSKTTLIRHLKVHILKFDVTREENNFTKSNDARDSVSCADCQKKFGFKADLIKHVKEHQRNHSFSEKNRFKDESFSCAHCSEMFKLKRDLITHIQVRKHQNDAGDPNIILLEKKSKVGKLKLHFPRPNDETNKRQFKNSVTEFYTLLSKNMKPRFFCAHCKEKFKFKTDLLLHVWEHMKEPKIPGSVHCPICGRKFPYRKCLRDHIAIHFKETFYRCKQCSVTAIKKHAVLSHTLNCHCEGSSFQCDTCEKTFSSYITFRGHKQSHANRKNSSSMFISDINEQSRGKTSLQKKAPCGQRDSLKFTKIFKCSVCDASFQTEDDLNKHFKLRHELKCKICSKKLSTRKNLGRHYLRMHSSARHYSCDHCGLEFASKYRVREHIMKHPEFKDLVPKLKCKLCGVLILHKSLNSHNATHHKSKNYVCEQCGASFARSDYLKKHMFKHTKERPHLCSYCAATFSRKDNLKSHERKHALLGDRMIPKPPIWKRPL